MASFMRAAIGLASFVVAYILSKAIYRVFFHPLARFPGPRLGAVTSLYGAYWDLNPNKSYVKTFPALHDKYGPIIRAWPNILHVRDMDSYNQIFRPGTKFDRQTRHTPNGYYIPLVEHSYFPIKNARAAKARKDLYSGFFSKGAVQRLEHLICNKVDRFAAVLKDAAANDEPVNLTLGNMCLTGEIILDYCFGKPLGALDAPGFQFPLILAIEQFFDSNLATHYFPQIFNPLIRLLGALPASMQGPFAAVMALKTGCRERIVQLMQRKETSDTEPTMLDVALNPNTEKGQPQLSLTQLTDDVVVTFVAGTDTTAHTMCQGTYGVLANPAIAQRLSQELREAIPTRDTPVSFSMLEKLPYLRGVVKEALRHGYGVPGPLKRDVPASGAVFCGQHIPPGTTVGHSAYCYHTDEKYFEDPFQFKPERWLDEKTFSELDSHLLSFSRGSRSCLGMNVALASLHLTFAHLFRWFELDLHETTPDTMVWEDCFTGKTRGHLKVKVRPIDE